MNIKMRYANAAGFVKLENYTDIKEVMINEDLLHPEGESIAIGFRNKDSSGIIEFTTEEFDRVAKDIKKKVHLVKGISVFREKA